MGLVLGPTACGVLASGGGESSTPVAAASGAGTRAATTDAAPKPVTFTMPGSSGGTVTHRLEPTALARRGPFTEPDGRITCTADSEARDRCDGVDSVAVVLGGKDNPGGRALDRRVTIACTTR